MTERAPIGLGLVLACALGPACVGAWSGATTAAGPAGAGPAPADAEALARDYRDFLDAGRTAARAAALATRRSGFRVVDPTRDAITPTRPGDRLVLGERGHSALFVVVGREPVSRGARLIGSHIDTPAPRLITRGLTRAGQLELHAEAYGAIKRYQWLGRPLALVGEVVARGGRRVEVELGLGDDAPLWATEVAADRTLVIAASSTPTSAGAAGPPRTLVDELHARYQLTAADLAAAELYLVPAEPAREVGVDRAFVGGHGQDDRANSYLAWRALLDLPAVPERTALVWLVDREEIGSTGPSGADARFLELAVAYLLAAGGQEASERGLLSALAATEALSADTPACVEPNWPEVHELKHAPVAGRGPALFPFTGRAGKQGGSAAHAELVARVAAAFGRAGVTVQRAELGAVDEGGGGTIAKYLGHRGVDVVDLGVCVINMHSPLELTAKADLWSTYLGFRHWLAEPAQPGAP